MSYAEKTQETYHHLLTAQNMVKNLVLSMVKKVMEYGH